MTDSPAIQGPLHAMHAAHGARFGPFSGWEMPLNYAEGGVVAEHTAARTTVGLFDVSHLGKTSVSGPGAADFVNACLSNDLGRITPGQAQYTLCCTESGGVVDDLLAYFVAPDEVFLVPNAANNAEVAARLAAAAPAGVTVTDLHTGFAVLAVQGPKSADTLDAVGLPSGMDYLSFADTDWRGLPVRVCRTGYTGEHGYELLPRWADAAALWEALVAAATPLGGRPAGLGARDTLRTEMGYPLHGHELSQDISPVQAGVGFAVGWKKDAFWGRDALTAERAAGPRRRLRGLLAQDRGVPREGMPVRDGAGRQIGVTTSGTFSPTLKQGIALALLDTDSGVGLDADVIVDVRGRGLPCRVVKPPFVELHTR
ncbi:MAG TPA: glycine cleavage system aminomethyltransferase GcvT [Pseudonocardiaceae bacterium]|nr:glycine cleavage system aminomethyltransferase GcvT [Pseudonocardiaceae bacterium]